MREAWRYRCPRGHTSWKSRTSGFTDADADYWCYSCHKSHDDAGFDELVDMKDPAEHHVADPEVTAV